VDREKRMAGMDLVSLAKAYLALSVCYTRLLEAAKDHLTLGSCPRCFGMIEDEQCCCPKGPSLEEVIRELEPPK